MNLDIYSTLVPQFFINVGSPVLDSYIDSFHILLKIQIYWKNNVGT